MSVQTQIDRIKSNVTRSLAKIAEKGVTVPADANSDSLESLIDSIETGGGGGGGDASAMIDALIDGSVTEINSNVTKIERYALYFRKYLEIARFPEATSVGAYAFYNSMWYPVELYLPKVKTIGEYAFHSFASDIAEPEELIIIDLPVATSIGKRSFYGAFFKCLILRSNTVCTLANADAFSNTNIGEDTPWDLYIYVPSALISAYQSASNWSNYAEYFRPLENYTVDGTTTGEIDLSKI